jgi:glycosyltransferase involved in cell wall biosynthesis
LNWTDFGKAARVASGSLTNGPSTLSTHRSFAPDVSVVLPTYNRRQYLARAIESVLSQTCRWELVVVDDGSADDSFTVVEPYLSEHSSIKYVRHSNRRQSLSRNAGIQASVGRYVTFLDSDDVFKADHLGSRLRYMSDHPDVDLIQGGFEVVGDPWVVDFFNPEKKVNIYDCVVGPTFFGKRQVFFELGGYTDGLYFEDTEFWDRAQQAFRVATINSPVTYLKYQTGDSLTVQAARAGSPRRSD